MAKIREIDIEREEVTGVAQEPIQVERPKRSGGGFSIGMLFGVLLIAGAIMAFAYTQGSFQSAGVEADQAQAQVERQVEEMTETAAKSSETRSN